MKNVDFASLTKAVRALENVDADLRTHLSFDFDQENDTDVAAYLDRLDSIAANLEVITEALKAASRIKAGVDR